MKPGSPEWSRLITASKVAAILGVSPWESQRSVWHLMHGDVQREESSEVQRRGHYLEPAILAWWNDQHPWADDWVDQPSYSLGDWAAATPDRVAWLDCLHEDRDHCSTACQVLVEAKSAAIMDDWGDPGTDVIPAYYLVQVYWSMHVSGIHRCHVPVIGPRLKFSEYVVDYTAEIGADLERRMRAFYDTLAADEPPPLDDSLATFDVIRKLHPDIETGEEVEVPEDVAAELVEAVEMSKTAEPRERLAKATVIDLMGRAQYATCNGYRIARRQPNKTGVSFVTTAKDLRFITEEKSA